MRQKEWYKKFMEGEIKIETPASLDQLKKIRKDLEKFFTWVDEQKLFTILLMVDEVVTNIIKYGYAGEKGIIVIQASFQNGIAEIMIDDQAPPFNPLTHPPVDIEKHIKKGETHGLGIHVLRTFSDECLYERLPTGNRLVLRKKL